MSIAATPHEKPRTPPSLPLVDAVARELDEAEIAYCHWKSNADLERSLSGENDLDLLVLPADGSRFAAVLGALGFVHATAHPGIPGIESYLGYDEEGDRLIHVHAHYRLVLGDDRTKNYRLPIEDAYIGSARNEIGLPAPAPEFELVVFVIRMALKYCTWDEIVWSALRGRRAEPTARERRELDFLRARADARRVGEVLDASLPYVGRELFGACMRPLVEPVPAVERARTARRLEIALQPHARRSRGADRALRVGGRVAVATKRHLGRVRKRRLVAGGAMVGLIGGDGAGKSTALAELEAWLRPEFDINVVHLGKPPWSTTTYAVRAALKAGTLAATTLRRHVPPARGAADVFSSYRPLFWLLCTARDRQRAYRKARRFTARGGVVLCDRYPHPSLTSMEVPLIRRRAAEDGVDGRLVQAMARLEESYHESIVLPELLVALRLDPEVAVSRKHAERPESVRRRGAEIWNIDWNAAGAHAVDASQPREAVLKALKKLVWSALKP